MVISWESFKRGALAIGVGATLIFLLTEWVIYGLHLLVFDLGDEAIYISGARRFAKFFALAIFFSIVGFRVIQLTTFGRNFLRATLTVGVGGLLISSLWLYVADEDGIHILRVYKLEHYAWEDVEEIHTNVYRENNMAARGPARRKPRHVIEEYKLVFPNKVSVNLWTDIDSVFDLDRHLKNELSGVTYVHHTSNRFDKVRFDQAYTSYYEDALEKAYVVFGYEK